MAELWVKRAVLSYGMQSATALALPVCSSTGIASLHLQEHRRAEARRADPKVMISLRLLHVVRIPF